MEQRIFHGNLTPEDLADRLLAEFNRGNLRAQSFGNEQHQVVQIAAREIRESGGQTSLSLSIQKAADGISVKLGEQAWMGIAASLGQTALSVWRNPWNILGRLDDLAQDIESLQLAERAWKVVEACAREAGATFELSERLRRMECEYCGTANMVGESNCIACGAPLGSVQPGTCPHCGYLVTKSEEVCPNCQQPLARK